MKSLVMAKIFVQGTVDTVESNSLHLTIRVFEEA